MDQHTTDRRELIKKAMALAPVYAAPAILVSERPVMAQGPSAGACTGGTCGGGFPNCNNDPNCFCFGLADGSSFCGGSATCGAPCDLQTPCGAGFVCQVDTCCGPGVCIDASSECLPGAPSDREPIAGPSNISRG